MPKRKRRGEIAENKAAIAVKELKEEGKIDDWKKSEKFDRNDKRGIDIFITYTKNEFKKIVLLQVKSQVTKSIEKKLRLEEIESGIWYREGIYTIEAGGKKPKSKIKKKILRILEIEGKLNCFLFYNFIKYF
ncbi:MAG: hypothetical protein QME61_03435 [Patescibacteria group bacterium]|nr:hypothetical protein [Patescibacteria group bacterium]